MILCFFTVVPCILLNAAYEGLLALWTLCVGGINWVLEGDLQERESFFI